MVLKRIEIQLQGRTKASTNISLAQDSFWLPGTNTEKTRDCPGVKGYQVKENKTQFPGQRYATTHLLFIRNANLTGHSTFLFIKSIIPIIEQSSSHEQVSNELFLTRIMVQPKGLNHYWTSWFPGKLFENADSRDPSLEISSPMGQTPARLQVPRWGLMHTHLRTNCFNPGY